MNLTDDRNIEQRLTAAFQAMGDVVTEQTAGPGRVPIPADLPDAAPPRSRWVLPLVAAASVAVLILATVVAVRALKSPAVPSTDRRTDATAAPTPAPSRATESPTPTPPRSQTATQSPSPSPSTTPGAHQTWTQTSLLITPTSLGAVTNGMTLAQAEVAAGMPFALTGDGAQYPAMPSGAPHLYIRPHGDANFPACLGAQGDGKGTPTIYTAEGFHLGDTVAKLKTIYANRLRYLPQPQSGLSPHAGYVLPELTGTLAFAVDPTGTRVIEIAGSIAPLTPSGCPG